MNKFEDARMNKFEDARSTGQKEENIMGKYEQDARLLLEYVGGKENIAAVSPVSYTHLDVYKRQVEKFATDGAVSVVYLRDTIMHS